MKIVGRFSAALALAALFGSASAGTDEEVAAREYFARGYKAMFPSRDETCRITYLPIRDLDRKEWIDGKLRVCKPDYIVEDITTGDGAKSPDQELTYIVGQATEGSPYALTRSKTNRPYDFEPMSSEVRLAYTPDASMSWDAAKFTLPFVPMAVVTRDDPKYSDPWHLFGKLEFIDREAAYPLDEHSWVLSVDAIQFAVPRAFPGYLTWYQNSKFVTVWYVQDDESPAYAKRALIAILPLSEYGERYRALAAKSEILDADRFQDFAIKAAAFLAVLKVGEWLSSVPSIPTSSLGGGSSNSHISDFLDMMERDKGAASHSTTDEDD